MADSPLVGMYRRRWNSDPARTLALFSAMAAPGTVMAARFGPDAADIHLGSRRTRIRYEWISGVRIEDGVVELRGLDGGAYPRELFPDFAIAYIRALNAGMAASR
ncbi:hypothetical protein [Nocardia sp. CA-145437]|uniref:hypothetical protein n=1 Tax=Nocardia sp. CA-145437 TaxID=3239980 RepID=UPI003D987F9B